MKKIIIPSLSVVIIVGVIFALVLKNKNIVPQISVSDQSIISGQVLVSSVTAVAPSWLVIQTETNSAPGPVVGYVKINKGESKNVVVKVEADKITPKLFAMVHVDDGQKDSFDFPVNDMPLVYKDEMVSKLFLVK